MDKIPVITPKFVYAIMSDKHGKRLVKYSVIKYSVEHTAFCVEEGDCSCNYLHLEQAFLTPAEAVAHLVDLLLGLLHKEQLIAQTAQSHINVYLEEIGNVNTMLQTFLKELDKQD